MTIYLDLETTEWIRPNSTREEIAQLPIGVVSTCYQDEYRSWFPDDIPALWDYLIQASETLCGWNIASFDLPIIRHAIEQIGLTWQEFQVLDLFDIIRKATGRWYKLEVISQFNLHRGKLANGGLASEWLSSGDVALKEKAVEYCLDDTRLCVELWELCQTQPIVLPSLPRKGQRDELRLRIDPDGTARLLPREGTPASFTF